MILKYCSDLSSYFRFQLNQNKENKDQINKLAVHHQYHWFLPHFSDSWGFLPPPPLVPWDTPSNSSPWEGGGRGSCSPIWLFGGINCWCGAPYIMQTIKGHPLPALVVGRQDSLWHGGISLLHGITIARGNINITRDNITNTQGKHYHYRGQNITRDKHQYTVQKITRDNQTLVNSC